MKNIILSLLITSLSVTLIFGQNKPNKNHFGIGIDYKLQREVHIIQQYDFFSIGTGLDYRIESYNYFPALKFDYFLNDDISLNIFFRPSLLSKSEKYERTSPSNYLNEMTISRFSMDLGLGLEKHFFKKMKIDPFIGVNVHYIFSNKEKYKNNSEYSDNSLNYLKYRYLNVKEGIASHGVYSTLNFGLNYYISQNFSLGINMDLGYRYSIQKGKETLNRKVYEFDQNGVEIDYQEDVDVYELNKVNNGFIYSFSIKTAFYFSIKKKVE